MKLVVKPDALRRLRLELPMSPSEFATAVQLDKSRITQLESGTHPGIKPETARRMAEVLGKPVADFTEVIPAEVAS